MDNWADSLWFKEWLRLARKEYQGKYPCSQFTYIIESSPEPNNFNNIKRNVKYQSDTARWKRDGSTNGV